MFRSVSYHLPLLLAVLATSGCGDSSNSTPMCRAGEVACPGGGCAAQSAACGVLAKPDLGSPPPFVPVDMAATESPVFSLSAETIELPTTIISNSEKGWYSVRHLVDGLHTVTRIEATGRDADELTVGQGCARDYSRRNEWCETSISFAPVRAGEVDAVLRVWRGDVLESTAKIHGLATVGAADLRIVPSEWTVGDVVVGSDNSRGQDFIVHNESSIDQPISVLFHIPTDDSFSITRNDCSTILASARTCSVIVTFKPRAA
jgi:hypothetical protein